MLSHSGLWVQFTLLRWREWAIEWRDFCKHFRACVQLNIFAMSVEYFHLWMVNKTKWQFSFQLWGLKPAVVHLWWRSTVQTPDFFQGLTYHQSTVQSTAWQKLSSFKIKLPETNLKDKLVIIPSIVLKLIQLNWCQLLACKNTYPGSTQCWWFHPGGCSLEMYKIIVGKLVSFDPIIKLSIITQLLITYALVINFLNNWLKIHNWLVLKFQNLITYLMTSLSLRVGY